MGVKKTRGASDRNPFGKKGRIADPAAKGITEVCLTLLQKAQAAGESRRGLIKINGHGKLGTIPVVAEPFRSGEWIRLKVLLSADQQLTDLSRFERTCVEVSVRASKPGNCLRNAAESFCRALLRKLHKTEHGRERLDRQGRAAAELRRETEAALMDNRDSPAPLPTPRATLPSSEAPAPKIGGPARTSRRTPTRLANVPVGAS